jgi:hypothetical protein
MASNVGGVLGGLYEYYRRGDVSLESRSALLQLHCQTNGYATDKLASLLKRIRRPPKPALANGLLGSFSVDRQARIAEQISRDGFYVFEQRLSVDLCDAINAFASTTPAMVEGGGKARENLRLFDPVNPISKTYRILEGDIVNNIAMQQLMADPVFRAVAERYLNAAPVLSMVNLWWSPTFGEEPGGDAAQEFHFDFDPPPSWLLFFVYLTDVGPDNGPHVFVRGSHLAGHPAAGPLLKRGYVRISDREIAAVFGRENVVELYGKRGTVLAVDTRGFHKGSVLKAGSRLMAQLTFSLPPFSGAHGRRQPIKGAISPALAAAVAECPGIYERYL